MPPVELEVCTDSAEGAGAAEQGGADRVELCADLRSGGLTPSLGAIVTARRLCRLELVVLIRPRAGDFCYTPAELECMRRDLAAAKGAGADGVALGVLRLDATIDRERTAELVELSRPLRVTFHRAFDLTPDPEPSLDLLLELGVDRLLTSGQAARVSDGLGLLQRLVRRAGDRLTVMPGGGVREDDVAQVVRATGARAVHFTAGAPVRSPMARHHADVELGSQTTAAPDELLVTSAERVRRFRQALRMC